MRYVTADCHTDGAFLPETEAEEAEAARLNAPAPPRPWDHVILGQSRALLLIGALDTLIEAALELQDVAPGNPLAPIAVRRGRAALAALEQP